MSGEGKVAGFSECCDELAGSTKREEIFD